MSAAREEKARSEARLEAAREPRGSGAYRHRVAMRAGRARRVRRGRPRRRTARCGGDRKSSTPKQDRERLGAVNLRAEEELTEIEATADHRHRTRGSDRSDPAAAAGDPEPQQGRPRAAARRIRHRQRAFRGALHVLFGGGTAELQLIESDDPLEAGLEILARPPGKKPQVMTFYPAASRR